MSTTGERTPTAFLASLKEAHDAQAFQQLVLGMAYEDAGALEQAYEALVEEAEQAGDNEAFPQAAEAFRKLAAMAWTRDDNRMVENFSTQALYYGTLVDFDTLLQNYATAWAIWAHLLSTLKPRDRARLQDFARFGRSFQLGLREREEPDQRVGAAVSLLAPTFESLGALNLKKIDDRKADLTDDTATLWDEVSNLVAQLAASAA